MGTKITALTANTTPAGGDIFVIVDDPSGTPVTQKITLTNLLGSLPSGFVIGTTTGNLILQPVADLDVKITANLGGINIQGTVDNIGVKFANTGTGGLGANIFASAGTSGYGQGKLVVVRGSDLAALTTWDIANGNVTIMGTLTVNGDQTGAADHVFDAHDDIALLEKWRAGERLPFEVGDLLNRDRLLRDAIVQMNVRLRQLEDHNGGVGRGVTGGTKCK